MNINISSIEVKKLFGYLTYDIKELNNDIVTFIIGKNGMGKTTILKLLNKIGEQSFSEFRTTQFDSLKFVFRVGRTSKAVYFKKNKKGNCQWRVETGKTKSKFQDLPFGYSDLMSDNEKVEFLEKNTSEVQLEPCGNHWSVNGRGHHGAKQVLKLMAPIIKEKYITEKNVNTEELLFLKEFKVAFISADRLTKTEDDELQVDIISQNMINVLEQHVIASSSFSKTFEHDILTKLLSAQKQDTIKLATLKEKLKEINDLESKVQSYGLYPDSKKIELPNRTLTENDKRLINTYLSDKSERIKPQENFLNLLELFEELMNKSLAEKVIKPDSHVGLKVNRPNGDELKLDQLSSGEQHLIILSYKLIFEIEDDSLVLIDEPEISMHLEWQKSFANMLDKIGEKRNIRFLCATHSPTIIGSRRNALRAIK